jgi:hypothetical protein
MNAAVLAAVVLSSAVVLIGFWGCGTGPLEQSYAIQSGAVGVNGSIGEKTDIPEIMKALRTANLNLVDRLTAGTPEQVMRAAAQVGVVSRDVGNYQPAIGSGAAEEAAVFKRLSQDVKDYAVEVGKAAANGQLPAADQYYARLFLTCNECHRLFRGQQKPAGNIDIPELEKPKPPAEPAPQPPAN